MPARDKAGALRKRAEIGRADLVLTLSQLDRMGQVELAESLIEALGFEAAPDSDRILEIPWPEGRNPKPEPEPPLNSPAVASVDAIGIWTCHSRVDVPQETDSPEEEIISPAQPRQRKPVPRIPPALRSSQMLNLWDAALIDARHTSQIDVPLLVSKLSMGKPISSLPRLTRSTFASDVVLLMDRRERLRPMFSDQGRMFCHLSRLLARSQCQWVSLPDGPFLPEATISELPETSRVIVVSDFDVLEPDGGASMARYWDQAFKRLQQKGLPTASFGADGVAPSPVVDHYPVLPARADSVVVEALVAAMARVGKSEVNRLRYLRSVLPNNGFSSLADEIAVWNHPDRQPAHPEQWAVKPDRLHYWMDHFSSLETDVYSALTAAILCWRESLPGDTAGFEALIGSAAQLEPSPDGSEFSPILERAMRDEQTFEVLDCVFRSNNPLLCQIASKHQQNPRLQSFLRAAQHAALRQGLPQPLGLKHLTPKNDEYGVFRQRGKKLEWINQQSFNAEVPLPLYQGIGRWLDVSTQKIVSNNSPLVGTQYTLQSPNERMTFKRLNTPVWASSYWRESAGVYAAHPHGVVFHLREADSDNQSAYWEATDNIWSWASSSGVDDHGLWAEFTVNKVTQRLRWIPPGEFQMGSPENEPERDDDEIQHHVTLTEGYWLADTACTQALWEAVTGNNPSNFKAPDRPVETVSWDDVKDFIEQLNDKVPGLQSRLPTEAEWEYAARAGSQTPFWWGSTLSPEQANYDGNYPYADGEKGKYREETLPVKEFEPNPWGLYQVHGNVEEWCEDWHGEYKPNAVVNPDGAESGERRVYRGGCWGSNGWRLRAAYRNNSGPGIRFNNLGFRLCAGQSGAEPR